MTKITLSGNPPDPNYKGGGAPQDVDESGMHKDYWILSDEERAKGFIRPLRRSYIHEKCGGLTTMNYKIAETYAVNPKFYGATFCSICRFHFRVGETGEFVWEDGTKVGI